METIAEKLINLRLITRKLCIHENSANKKFKSTITLYDKMLFLLKDKDLSPIELMDILCITKSNLAHLAKTLIHDDFITKINSNTKDNRQINYSITALGQKYLEKYLTNLEINVKKALSSKAEYDDANDKLDDIIELLMFI